MAHLLVVSPAAVAGTSDEAPVSALALLPHSYALVPPDASVVNEAERYDVIVLDGRTVTPDGAADGFWLGPTLLDNVTLDMTVYTD